MLMTPMLRVLGRYWRSYFGIALLLGLYLTSLESYVLFHTLAEMIAVAVAACAFIIAWNGQRLYANSYLLVVGIGCGSVAVLALLHALAYKGMGVFPHADSNLPTQLWVASRGVLAFTLLAAPLLLGRRLSPRIVLLAYAGATALLVCAIFVWRIFPTAYIDRPGGGLTAFKIVAEYVIVVIMVIGLLLLWQRRSYFDRDVLRELSAAVVLAIASELAFTSYVSVYGRANLIGHLLMVISFYFIYLAIVRTAFIRPLHLLFHDRERLLVAERSRAELAENLNREISHRVKNNLAMIAGLLQLQIAQQRDERVSSILSDATSRLLTFASLHEEMQADQQGAIDLFPVLERIAFASRDALSEPGVTVSVEGASAVLPVSIATHFAVVANELITNALKHGRPGPDERLRVDVTIQRTDRVLHLRVWNSGNPIPAGFDPSGHAGMGLRLVRDLVVTQLGGTFRLVPEAGGSAAQVTAPLHHVQ
jgi:two-component sensor histidine kinase